MASTSWVRRREASADDRSAGGKLIRGRRNPRFIPYDRPSPVTDPSPNWLTGVVLPKIATGAATLLSSFISSPNDSDDSSSSSEEEGDGGDASPADCSDESTHSHDFIDGAEMLNKEDVSTPEFDKYQRKESQITIGKSETKHLIEKLIMQETFSREERDNLMRMINSRVIDGSIRNEGLVTRSDIPDFCTKAIMEAKQWIEEKKESSSKLQLAHGISIPNTVMSPHDTEGGSSSPVDLAKAYMRNRPPWSSPSLNSVVEKTPTRVGIDVLNDEAPHGSLFSSSKRKLSSGPWSIQDEIRRVRSKATEDMLKTVPSQKNNLSSLSLEPEGIGNTLPNGRMEAGLGGRLQDSNLFPSVKSIDASLNLTVTGVNASGGLPASAVDTTQDGIQSEDLQLQAVTRAQIEGIENIQTVEKDKAAADGSRPSAIPEPISEDANLRFKDQSGPTSDGDIQFRVKATDREVESNQQHSDGKDSIAVSSSHGNLADHHSLEETCELLSETSVEIPGMDQVDGMAINNSLSNSIKHTEDSSKQSAQLKNVKQVVKGKSTKVGIGQGRKLRPKGKPT